MRAAGGELAPALRPALLLGLLLALVPAPAAAGQYEHYGAGPQSQALAGAGRLLPDCGAASIGQPAAIGLGAGDCTRIFGLVGRVDLAEVEGVTRLDGIDGAMPPVVVQPASIGFDMVKNLGPWFRAGGWVFMSLPELFHHGTKDPWVPYSVQYQNRFARSMASLAISARIPILGLPRDGKTLDDVQRGGLHVGFGLTVRPRGIIDIDLDLIGRETDDGDGVIDVVLRDVRLIARPDLRPELSVVFDFGSVHPALEGLRLGGGWRNEATTSISPIGLDVTVLGLDELNGLFALVERLQAQVWLGLVDFYDPHQVHLSAAFDRPRFAVSVDAQWNHWARLGPSWGRVVQGGEGQAGQLDLELRQPDGSTRTFSYSVRSGRTVDTGAFRDTVQIAVGGVVRPPPAPLPDGEIAFEVRAGYRYKPGLARPSEGLWAGIDGDTHTFGGGLQVGFPTPATFKGPFTVELAVQGQRLAGLELGRPSSTGVGVDDFPVRWSSDASWSGGWVVTGGLGLGLAF